jgi:uncharacterized repeat protein (TIGR01451 family)
VVLALAAFVAALAAWQGAAMGVILIQDATIDGATSTSAPPGSVLRTEVTGVVAGGDTWRGTAYDLTTDTPVFPPDHCVNTGDKGAGLQTVSFNLTAPGAPGEYNAPFWGSVDDDCATVGGALARPKALTVQAPAPNPNLPPRCGIDVMLVLDESGSINTSGKTEVVRNATRAFLNALSGTGAAVSIVDFSTTAARPVPYTTVTDGTIASTFEPYLANGYKPSGWTNWEDAFTKVREANTQGTVADLVVFITDGDPTARNTETGQETGLVEGAAAAMRPALAQADLVKGQGSHVFALGVGAAVTKPESARRLTAVSGFDQYPATPFARADYTLVQDFDDLAQRLREIVIELCQASVTVTKLLDVGGGQFRPDRGWRFTATVSTDPGGYAWLQPAPPPATGPRSRTTDSDGIATFQWKPADAGATSTVTLAEDLKPGYEFVDISCSTNAPGRTRRRTIRRTTPRVAGLTIRPGEYSKCTVRNRLGPGTPPPEPPVPPAPPAPPPPTVIDVVKTAPRTARVGQRVAFELTVSNVGSVAAQNVIMADVPPAALTLAGLQSTGGARVRLARGNAYWHLGTLAPGARRTVRGTVLIEAGSPGPKRNYVLATAVNAQTAQDHSDTRVLAQRRVIPPVTG